MVKIIKITLITLLSLILLLALLVSTSMIYLITIGETIHIHPSPYQIADEHFAFAIIAFFAFVVKIIAIVSIIFLAKFMRIK